MSNKSRRHSNNYKRHSKHHSPGPLNKDQAKSVPGDGYTQCKYSQCNPEINCSPNVIINVPEGDKAQEIKLTKWGIIINAIGALLSFIVTAGAVYSISQTSKSLKITQASLDETKSQFFYLNDAIIQIDSVHLLPMPLTPGEPMKFSYYIKNLKQVPVKIISTFITVETDDHYVGNEDFIQKFKGFEEFETHKNRANEFCTIDQPSKRFSTAYVIDQPFIDSLLFGSYRIYFSAVVQYKNTIRGDTAYYVYRCETKPHVPNLQSVYVLINENFKHLQNLKDYKE